MCGRICFSSNVEGPSTGRHIQHCTDVNIYTAVTTKQYSPACSVLIIVVVLKKPNIGPTARNGPFKYVQYHGTGPAVRMLSVSNTARTRPMIINTPDLTRDAHRGDRAASGPSHCNSSVVAEQRLRGSFFCWESKCCGSRSLRHTRCCCCCSCFSH